MEKTFNEQIHEQADMKLRGYSITHVENFNCWIITYMAVPSSEIKYLATCSTQQDAIDRVLTELGV